MTVVVAVVSLVAAIATALAATVVYVSALKVVASTIVSEGALVGASLHHRNGSISLIRRLIEKFAIRNGIKYPGQIFWLQIVLGPESH